VRALRILEFLSGSNCHLACLALPYAEFFAPKLIFLQTLSKVMLLLLKVKKKSYVTTF
jgi:hypothetical protein